MKHYPLQHKTIKDVKKTLKVWGEFWASKEVTQGFASKSNIVSLKEKLDLGCSVSGSSHLLSNLADSIYVPEHINNTDEAIKHLGIKHKQALTQKYIKKNKPEPFWIAQAENRLIGLI